MSSETPLRDDWAAQLTEKVGQVVDVIRDQTVGRVQKVVRVVIFGALALSVVVLVLMMLTIGLVRLFNNEVFDQRVWASYFLIGGIFVVLGTLISMMRHSRS
jgi:CHASE2 domain-containing sensor protein